MELVANIGIKHVDLFLVEKEWSKLESGGKWRENETISIGLLTDWKRIDRGWENNLDSESENDILIAEILKLESEYLSESVLCYFSTSLSVNKTFRIFLVLSSSFQERKKTVKHSLHRST